jgi:hypothetical protein
MPVHGRSLLRDADLSALASRFLFLPTRLQQTVSDAHLSRESQTAIKGALRSSSGWRTRLPVLKISGVGMSFCNVWRVRRMVDSSAVDRSSRQASEVTEQQLVVQRTVRRCVAQVEALLFGCDRLAVFG